MSDSASGQKMFEVEALQSFLEAYEQVVEMPLLYGCSQERPDFICYRQDGTPVGIELVRVMRDPRDAHLDSIFNKAEYMIGAELLDNLYEQIEKKEKKRCQPDWDHPDNTILVLQLVDCPVSDLYLDDSLKNDFESYGFAEIWIADYTCEESYGAIDLFCLSPSEWWGYYERRGHSWKPYG